MGCILRSIHSTRDCKDYWLSPEAGSGVPQSFSWVPKKELAVPSPWFQAFGLKCQRIQFCRLMPPNLWRVVSESQVPRQACAAPLLLMLPPIFFGWGHVCQISLLWSCHFPLLCCRTKPRSCLRSKAKRFYLLLLYQILFLKCFHVNVITNIKDLQHRAFLNLMNSIFPDAGDGTDGLPSC